MGFTFGGMGDIIPTLNLNKQTPPPTPRQDLVCSTTENESTPQILAGATKDNMVCLLRILSD